MNVTTTDLVQQAREAEDKCQDLSAEFYAIDTRLSAGLPLPDQWRTSTRDPEGQHMTEHEIINQLAELSKTLRLEHARLLADRDIKASTCALHSTEFQAGVRPDIADSIEACTVSNAAFGAFRLRVKALNAAARGLVEQLSQFRVA
jgi:hypothetical protein